MKKKEVSTPQPVEENPIAFFYGFQTSQFYSQSYIRFYEKKVVEPDVTESERREAFERSEQAKVALFAYAQKSSPFGYNPRFYSPETNQAIENYIDHVRTITQAMQGGITREERERLDFERTGRHIALAKSLVANQLAPSDKMGRAFGRLILIQQNLDTYEDASMPDIKRIERFLR